MLDKQIPIVHSKGLNKESLFQDKSDVTFALNAIRNNHEGGRQEYQSEPGNELSNSLPVGYQLLGSIYGQNDEVYLISTNGTTDEIGLFKQGTYNTLANLALGHSTQFPITGEYRVRNGCERTIYWGDGNVNDYWFNIDKPDEFKTAAVFDPNKFKFVPNIQCPKIDLEQVNSSGGNLELGSYYFQLEIVDKDLNSLYRTDITPQTVIYDEDQSDAYTNIDGGLNAPQYDPAIGGLPTTNKSITLRFSNLDTSFDYLRVNVIREIAGTQVVDAHTVGQLIPISFSELEWTYTGYNVSSGDTPVDYSSLIIPNVRYKSSNVQEQVQGRLVRGDLKQDQMDYDLFQAAASAVSAQWIAKEVPVTDQFEEGNPKDPNTYWTGTTFQGDEVMAFAIQYLLENGEWTPEFPLIGRASTVNDVTQLLVVADTTPGPLPSTQVWKSDVDHIDPSRFESFFPGYIGSNIRRWKVFNTASITTSNTVTHPYDYIGEFGYHESDNTTYPDLSNCESESIWGNDSSGNAITDANKIRHFRFPDRRLIPHVTADGDYIQPLGVKFDNITYPSTKIVGHRFCHAIRTANDRTVVDSGWLTRQFDNANLAFAPSPTIVGAQLSPVDTWINTAVVPASAMIYGTYGRYNSGQVMFNNSVSNPSYVKLNSVYRFDYIEEAPIATFDKIGGGTFDIDYSSIVVEDQGVPDRQNYKLSENIFIPRRSLTLSNFSIDVNAVDHLSPDSMINTEYPLEDISPILGATVGGKSDQGYVYKKVDIQPYENILNLNYNYIHFNHTDSLLSSQNEFYGGDSVITPFSTMRALYQTDYLTGISYYRFEERQANFCLRHGGTEEPQKYYTNDGNYDYILGKFAGTPDNGEYDLLESSEIKPEFYGYNKDYTVQSFEQGKVSLPLNFDYCADCRDEYPNRLIFSPQSFEEEGFDLYRINKVNDYIDLPAHRGRITGIKYQNNQLLVHTEDTTFILQPNPQQIATDQNTAYLTTGDFLSIPPQELLQTDIGTAGCQSKQSMCDTPFGHYWADQKRGEVFGWNGKLEVLSNNGLQQWFKENLPSELIRDFYRVNQQVWPLNSTLLTDGVGVILYYDPRFKRLMITKKDYLPIDQREEFVVDDPLITVWSIDNEYWRALDPDNIPYVTDSTDPSLFEDKSWTLSYSFLDQSFTSWHSYLPAISFRDGMNFYTTPLSNAIYKHLEKGSYQNYYGTKYDFILEYLNFDLVSSNSSNIYYVGYTQQWDPVARKFKTVDSTFNNLMVYNFEQSTGLQTLNLQNQHTNPYQNNSLTGNSLDVIKTDQNYKIAGIYDMSTNFPVVTSDWSEIQNYTGYIDLVPNSVNINSTKNQYDWGNIWDKFTFVRLFFKPAEDYKKSIILQVLNNQQSVR